MSGADRVDGRRQRGEDNRGRIVLAMLSLIQQGEYTPSAEQVAVRAEVSLRTVFRHFADMERLYREISNPIEAELRGVASTPFQAQDWKGRVLELVDRRSRAFETMAHFRRASNAHRHRSEALAAAGRRLAVASREILRHNLPEPLRESPSFEVLDLLLSVDVWLRLRDEQGLPEGRARDVLKFAVDQVLKGAGGSDVEGAGPYVQFGVQILDQPKHDHGDA
jgi:AcrR family transcriptional regulator